MNSTTLGERIRELRIKNGYSQEMLASLLGVTRQSVSHYESNRRIPTLSSLLRLAELFQVPVDTFVNRIPAGSADHVRENTFLVGLSADALNYTNITPLESQLLRYFRAMGDDDREQMIALAETLSGKRNPVQ